MITTTELMEFFGEEVVRDEFFEQLEDLFGTVSIRKQCGDLSVTLYYSSLSHDPHATVVVLHNDRQLFICNLTDSLKPH